MLIEGPMNISIADPASGEGRVLMITFTQEFQGAALGDQGEAFRSYLQMLQESIVAIGDEADHTRAGMMIVQQFAEQLLPHIESGDLALEESMVIQISDETQAVALGSLLNP
ncbi:MAG: transcriptional regulator [Sedimenticola sp.]